MRIFARLLILFEKCLIACIINDLKEKCNFFNFLAPTPSRVELFCVECFWD